MDRGTGRPRGLPCRNAGRFLAWPKPLDGPIPVYSLPEELAIPLSDPVPTWFTDCFGVKRGPPVRDSKVRDPMTGAEALWMENCAQDAKKGIIVLRAGRSQGRGDTWRLPRPCRRLSNRRGWNGTFLSQKAGLSCPWPEAL